MHQAIPYPLMHQAIPYPLMHQAIPYPLMHQAIPYPLIPQPIEAQPSFPDGLFFPWYYPTGETISRYQRRSHEILDTIRE
jgi:hypothetical protein